MEDEKFEIVLKRNLGDVYRFVSRMVPDGDDAEDITQEIFVKVWKNLKKIKPDENLKPFIFAIARNSVIDYFRKRKNIPFSFLDGKDGEENFGEKIVDLEPLPQEIFLRKEIGEEIQKALNQIPPEYKSIILLHLIEDLTFSEIAEMAGKPLNTVKSQYRRGFAALRKILII